MPWKTTRPTWTNEDGFAAERQRLCELSTHLLTRARSPTSVLAGLLEPEQQRLELAAIDCAKL